MIAFSKLNGGVWIIAIGTTLRRLTAKAAAYFIQAKINPKLFPHQLNVDISSDAETIVHSVRSFCNSRLLLRVADAVLEIDLENVFNTIR